MSKLNLPTKQERHTRFGSIQPAAGTKPTSKELMTDLQNKPHDYLFALDAVGICEVKYPVNVPSSTSPKMQVSMAAFKMTTSLGRHSKGINMSRIMEQLEAYRQENWVINLSTLANFTQELASRMQQSSAEIEVRFPWFYERTSPALKKTGLQHSEAFIKISYEKDCPIKAEIGIKAAITTLCPCSKEISEYSAHNQRGIVTITAVPYDPINVNVDWKAMLLEAAESNASSMLYPVLKRPDEKKVTETAYENPRFVEDMVRLVAADLYEMESIQAFTVECRNEESIHLHDAIAKITFSKE